MTVDARAEDLRFLRRSFQLALRGLGTTWPNPMVGCVLVRDGVVVAEGWHRRPGEEHAEVAALSRARGDARGSTAYVNLEPCCHFGRTPPCTDALIDAGVRRVVFGMVDPDPRVGGRGRDAMVRAGLEVVGPVLPEQAERLNEVYALRTRLGRPFVTLKAGLSLDGRTATRTGQSQWITGELARRHARRERARAGTVVVGVGTVLADDPQLTTRSVRDREPTRVVLDSQLRTPPGARLLDPGGGEVLLATTDRAGASRAAALEARGARILRCGPGPRVDLQQLLAELLDRGHHHLLVEGGGTVLGAFLDAGLVDRVLLYQAPLLLGGELARPAFGGIGAAALGDALGLTRLQVRRLGQDLLIEGRRSCSPASSAPSAPSATRN